MDQIMLTPNIGTCFITKQKAYNILTFYCGLKHYSSSSRFTIELWSNLTASKQWIPLSFIKMKQEGYHLSVDLSKLPPNKYEFTLRFKEFHDREWSWYGKPHQNGQVIIMAPSCTRFRPSVIEHVPQLQLIAEEHDINNTIDLYHLSARSSQFEQGALDLRSVDHPVHGYVSLLQKSATWLTPVAGMNYFNQNDKEKHQLLLYQDSKRGDVHLWMAVSPTVTCWLSFGPNNAIYLHCQPEDSQITDNLIHLLILTTQNEKDFTQLTEVAIDYYYRAIASISDRIDKVLNAPDDPILLDTVGYCTWNAFGQSVDYEKVLGALKSLSDNQIPVNYLLLDDGWQCTTPDNSRLASFDACPNKFPKGLKQTVEDIKRRHPDIKHVGVWHTLWGYWQGVDSELADAHGYGYFESSDNKGSLIGLLKRPAQFYKEFYSFLKMSGIDFVKVDNQGGFLDLSCDYKMRSDIWDSYRRALVDTSDEDFCGRVIHCMALTPHILLNPILSYKTKSAFRNSDDFFPDVVDSHAWHIYANTINLLWTHHYPVIADWDMFQSDHPFAEYHISSRAISGGPVYVTDLPGRHNSDLIGKLVGMKRNGALTLLRSCQPPRPAFGTVLKNPMDIGGLLCLYNFNREESANDNESLYVVCGFWNTDSDTKLGVVNNDLFSCSNLFKSISLAYVVTGLDQGNFLPIYPLKEHDTTSNFEAKDLTEYQDERSLLTRIAGFGSSLVSISCVKSTGNISVACLGLTDKLNGTRAVLKTEFSGLKQSIVDNVFHVTYRAHLSHKSNSCGFWIVKNTKENICPESSLKDNEGDIIIEKLFMDSREIISGKDWHWNKSNGLLTVDMLNTLKVCSDLDYFVIEIYIISIMSPDI